ncbi:hypothetical protein WKV53_14190 [Luteolibacter sp. Y139]|uniref:DUF3592 domain-containing protein n=1 Tax=Luteolibacter soli TaxID=3135280 RepID=A0ABU9AVV8_9BACT
MRRPVYRWKGFWLGVLVVAFLGWVWARSMGRDEGVWIHGVSRWSHNASVRDGWVVILDKDSLVSPRPPFDVAWYSQRRGDSAFDAASGWWLGWTFFQRDRWFFRWAVFPVWLPIAGFSALWGGWLGWRWRRVRSRLTEMEVAG